MRRTSVYSPYIGHFSSMQAFPLSVNLVNKRIDKSHLEFIMDNLEEDSRLKHDCISKTLIMMWSLIKVSSCNQKHNCRELIEISPETILFIM